MSRKRSPWNRPVDPWLAYAIIALATSVVIAEVFILQSMVDRAYAVALKQLGEVSLPRFSEDDFSR